MMGEPLVAAALDVLAACVRQIVVGGPDANLAIDPVQVDAVMLAERDLAARHRKLHPPGGGFGAQRHSVWIASGESCGGLTRAVELECTASRYSRGLVRCGFNETALASAFIYSPSRGSSEEGLTLILPVVGKGEKGR